MDVRIEPDRDTVRVIPRGELDLATTPQLRHELDELIAAGFSHVVVDLRELEFMDSAGLALLTSFHTAAQRDGWELSLIQGGRAIRQLFELSGMLEGLPFAPDAHANLS